MTVQQKKRQNIKHLEDFNSKKFIDWIMNYDCDNLGLNWKLDGFFVRFGKNKAGEFWFQTARSSVIYDPIDFIWFGIDKKLDDVGMNRCIQYHHLMKDIMDSELMNMIVPGLGFECEIFDKSNASLSDDKTKIRFVNLEYDASKFTTPITIFVHAIIDSSTGDVVDTPIFDPKYFKTISLHSSRFILPIDLEYFKHAVQAFSNAEINSITSFKHKDRELKKATVEKIRTLKDQFRAFVLHSAQGLHPLGTSLEGVVLPINTSVVKLITDEFRQLIFFSSILSK